jgi:hypothetical protein
MAGIICPPGWERVNWSANNWGCHGTPRTPREDTPASIPSWYPLWSESEIPTKNQVPPTVWSSGSFISYNLCHVVENSLERRGNGQATGTELLGLTWLCECVGPPWFQKPPTTSQGFVESWKSSLDSRARGAVYQCQAKKGEMKKTFVVYELSSCHI